MKKEDLINEICGDAGKITTSDEIDREFDEILAANRAERTEFIRLNEKALRDCAVNENGEPVELTKDELRHFAIDFMTIRDDIKVEDFSQQEKKLVSFISKWYGDKTQVKGAVITTEKEYKEARDEYHLYQEKKFYEKFYPKERFIKEKKGIDDKTANLCYSGLIDFIKLYESATYNLQHNPEDTGKLWLLLTSLFEQFSTLIAANAVFGCYTDKIKSILDKAERFRSNYIGGRESRTRDKFVLLQDDLYRELKGGVCEVQLWGK